MRFGDLATDREAEAAPPGIAAPRRIGPEEALEHVGEVLGRDAGTAVADLELTLRLRTPNGRTNHASGTRVLHRVVEEVRNDLADPRRIGVDDRVAIPLERQGYTGPIGEGPHRAGLTPPPRGADRYVRPYPWVKAPGNPGGLRRARCCRAARTLSLRGLREVPAVSETWVVAVDVGGTFTDAVAIGSEGDLRVAKVPSTPDDP